METLKESRWLVTVLDVEQGYGLRTEEFYDVQFGHSGWLVCKEENSDEVIYYPSHNIVLIRELRLEVDESAVTIAGES